MWLTLLAHIFPYTSNQRLLLLFIAVLLNSLSEYLGSYIYFHILLVVAYSFFIYCSIIYFSLWKPSVQIVCPISWSFHFSRNFFQFTLFNLKPPAELVSKWKKELTERTHKHNHAPLQKNIICFLSNIRTPAEVTEFKCCHAWINTTYIAPKLPAHDDKREERDAPSHNHVPPLPATNPPILPLPNFKNNNKPKKQPIYEPRVVYDV